MEQFKLLFFYKSRKKAKGSKGSLRRASNGANCIVLTSFLYDVINKLTKQLNGISFSLTPINLFRCGRRSFHLLFKN